ncbi:exported protein of unknown function (plasmid) [Ralstonia solanacearum Po82]|uniref:Uncharacterized protein n=1 Tax=Ralstonia solanacearum (strain Po82) TaxID=1031711 RepID=F6G7A5_RALS8|nr:exported protein of unknown function [Ralstonia solanacearum Po82]
MCGLEVSPMPTGMASGYACLDRIGAFPDVIVKPSDVRSGPIRLS